MAKTRKKEFTGTRYVPPSKRVFEEEKVDDLEEEKADDPDPVPLLIPLVLPPPFPPEAPPPLVVPPIVIDNSWRIYDKVTVGSKSIMNQMKTYLTKSGKVGVAIGDINELDNVNNDALVREKPVNRNRLSYSLKSLQINIEILATNLMSLINRGSRRYTKEQKLLVVRRVYKVTIQSWQKGEELDERLINEAEEDEDEIDFKELSLNKACVQVAEEMCISEHSVKAWVYEYHTTLDILTDEEYIGVIRPIETRSTCTVIMLFEMLSVIIENRKKGSRTNSTILQIHMRSNVRVGEDVTIENCPPVNLSRTMIQTEMNKTGAVRWGRIKACGSQGQTQETIDEKLEARKFGIWLYFITYSRSMYRDKIGRSLQIFQDESFINLNHGQHYSIGDLGNIPSEAVLRDWKRRSKAHGIYYYYFYLLLLIKIAIRIINIIYILIFNYRIGCRERSFSRRRWW